MRQAEFFALFKGSMMDIDSRIFVAGHLGLVGSALVRRLSTAGYENVLKRTRAELDLRAFR